MIDARDLGEWMVHLLEKETSGIFNATGPQQPLMWSDVDGGAAAQQQAALRRYTWVSDEFLQEHKANGGELPFWVPAQYENIFAVSVERAVKAGLTFRPAVETARDTLAWKGSVDLAELRAGMKLEREAELLKAWHDRA